MSPASRRRRILVVNPNTSRDVTETLVSEARRIAGGGSEPAGAQIVGATASFGAAALECRAELAIAAHAVLEAVAAHGDCDAAIIGAFADPGLDAAQEIAPMPVFGTGRSGLRAAGAGGRRFAIVTLGPGMRDSVLRAADEAGVANGLVSLHFIAGRVLDLAHDPAAFREALAEAAQACLGRHGAEAVLFGGAPFSGIGRVLSARIGAPVYDGLTCAVEAALRAPPRPPPAAPSPETADGAVAAKPMIDVSPGLARLIQARLDRR